MTVVGTPKVCIVDGGRRQRSRADPAHRADGETLNRRKRRRKSMQVNATPTTARSFLRSPSFWAAAMKTCSLEQADDRHDRDRRQRQRSGAVGGGTDSVTLGNGNDQVARRTATTPSGSATATTMSNWATHQRDHRRDRNDNLTVGNGTDTIAAGEAGSTGNMGATGHRHGKPRHAPGQRQRPGAGRYGQCDGGGDPGSGNDQVKLGDGPATASPQRQRQRQRHHPGRQRQRRFLLHSPRRHGQRSDQRGGNNDLASIAGRATKACSWATVCSTASSSPALAVRTSRPDRLGR